MNGDGPNWLGLLKWTLAHTDGTAPTEESEMSEENKQFLEAVMKECVNDEPALMNSILVRLTKYLDAHESSVFQLGALDTFAEEHLLADLEQLLDIVEQIDMALTFNKMGGLNCFMAILKNEHIPSSIKKMVAVVFGAICQNNLSVQMSVVDLGKVNSDGCPIVPDICPVLQHLVQCYVSEYDRQATIENPDYSLCAKLVSTMSCLVRHCPIGEEIFCTGHEYLPVEFTTHTAAGAAPVTDITDSTVPTATPATESSSCTTLMMVPEAPSPVTARRSTFAQQIFTRAFRWSQHKDIGLLKKYVLACSVYTLLLLMFCRSCFLLNALMLTDDCPARRHQLLQALACQGAAQEPESVTPEQTFGAADADIEVNDEELSDAELQQIELSECFEKLKTLSRRSAA